MEFGLNESQEILKESARKFFAGECPIAEVRRLMETDTSFDAALWKKLAEQGYTGIIFPEEFGGVGLGIVELARSLLHAVATREQRKKYLAPICRGEARATVAIVESQGSWDINDLQL